MGKVRTFTSSVLGPYDRGREFGDHHSDEIARTVAAYRRLFRTRAIRPFDLDLWSERAWQLIRDLDPTAAQEILGIAQGAAVPPRQIAALNARTELLAIANPTGVDECSTVVSLAEGRAPAAVQTWDWYHAMSESWLHWTIPHPDGRRVETVTEYGVLGKIGVNSDGVGVLFNMLHHEGDAAERLGYPLHLLSRRILDTATTVDEGVAVARSVTTSASSSLTLVSDDRAVSLEMFPGGVGVLEPEDDLLVRTNHFVSEDGRGGCIADAIGPSTRIRRDTLLDAFARRHPESAEDVVAAMDDHDEVGGVCVHPDHADDPVLRHATLATVAVDTLACTLRVSAGGPCLYQRG